MNPQVGLAWAAIVVAAGTVATVVFRRTRRTPQEKERRRRELVSVEGRVIEGYITGCEDSTVHYSYHWRGVRYDASQDLSDLPEALIRFSDYAGLGTVKFLSGRPVNSIVVSETWSGIPKALRKRAASDA